MESRICLVIIWGLECIRMVVGARWILGCRVKRIKTVGGLLALFGLLLMWSSLSMKILNALMWGLIVVSYFLMIEVPNDQGLKTKLVYGFLVFYQEELSSMVVGDLLINTYNIPQKYDDIISSFVSLCVLLSIGVIYHNGKENRKMVGLFKKMVIPILIMVSIEIMMVIVYLNFILKRIDMPQAKIIGSSLCVFALISIGVLFAIVYYVKYMNEKLEFMMEMKKKHYQLEVQYFEDLLEREKNTKKFRHDIVNHLAFIDNMLCKQEYNEAQNYLKSMFEYVEKIRNSNYETGNKMINIIINYYVSQLSDQVDVSVNGIWDCGMQISNFDLGTIISNILKNAVEAIKMSQLEDTKLSFEMINGDMFFKIVVRNSMDLNRIECDSKGNLVTTKKEKEYHGIGIKNVQEVVQKNNGIFEYSFGKNEFVSSVVFRKNNHSLS